jgi:hypothetical protein
MLFELDILKKKGKRRMNKKIKRIFRKSIERERNKANVRYKKKLPKLPNSSYMPCPKPGICPFVIPKHASSSIEKEMGIPTSSFTCQRKRRRKKEKRLAMHVMCGSPARF